MKKQIKLIKHTFTKIGIDTDSRALRGLSMSSAAGHNLSQGDLESESESEKYPRGANTGTGCYKNYEHHPAMHRRSNTSNQVETQLVKLSPIKFSKECFI